MAVVDDSDIVRRGLVTLLDGDPDLTVVGEAANGDQALHLVRRARPSVTLLDVRMPRRDGLSVVSELSSLTTVLMLTFTDDRASIHTAIADGAVGYLVHGTFDADSLGQLIRAAGAGVGTFCGPALDVMRDSKPQRPASRSTLGLSPRQAEVMDLIAEGRNNRDIASALFLAEKTVKNHINQVFAVLGVQSRGQAIVTWLSRT